MYVGRFIAASRNIKNATRLAILDNHNGASANFAKCHSISAVAAMGPEMRVDLGVSCDFAMFLM